MALLEGDAAQSFRYNALLWEVLPLYAAYVISVKKRKDRLAKGLMWGMLISAILFGLLRNIPLFAWLAPTVIR